MITLQPFKPLCEVLDRVIASYKPFGRMIGKPGEAKVSEEDLKALIKAKGDKQIALADDDVFAYFMPYAEGQEKAVFDAASEMFPKSKLLSISGRFHYPPKGYMGWHTNSNAEGNRMYATYATQEKQSFFRYYDLEKKEIVTEWEKKGWNFRAFQVKQDRLYWHCVRTDADRYSFGFRFGIS